MKLKLKENDIQKTMFGKVSFKKVQSSVNFYDYDGAILYSYSKSEFLNLKNLPSLPDRTSENLTCDGWNWTLDEIKKQLIITNDIVIVGAIYHTTDNKTHITCKPTETNPQAFIYLTPTVANAVTVDWGDGTTDTWTTIEPVPLYGTKSHTYTGATYSSVYDITISCSSGTYSFSGYFAGSVSNNSNCVYTNIKLANSVTSLGGNCFDSCYSLQSLTIPSSVTSLGTYCFQKCNSLKSIAIPSSFNSLGNYCFNSCYSLQSITIPSSVKSLGNSCFPNCSSLQSITIPSSVTSLGTYCFRYCYSLQSITIPSGVTSLSNYCFQNCSSLQSIAIPSDVESLGNYCFRYCHSLCKIYMQPTTPPTLSNTNTIPNNTNLVIYVPTGTLTAYQNATNWSSFASKMVEYDY